MSPVDGGLFAKVRHYKKLSQEIQTALLDEPEKWEFFQDRFNTALFEISKDIQTLEEDPSFPEEKLYKLRKVFEKRYRKYFLYGDYVKWSYEKPYGFPGDFKIIEDIYENKPWTKGFDRLWDNCFQGLAAAVATRERKEDFKRIIYDFVSQRKGQSLRILNVASGPAREIKEVADMEGKSLDSVSFDCIDYCDEALAFAQKLIGSSCKATFTKRNAYRIALKKNVQEEFPEKYNMIYSTGLFDYLDARIAIKLVSNLRKLLTSKGVMVVSNYREKEKNISAYLMEWITEWNLVYRTEEEFREVFMGAGFPLNKIKMVIQKCGVMQYCIAEND